MILNITVVYFEWEKSQLFNNTVKEYLNSYSMVNVQFIKAKDVIVNSVKNSDIMLVLKSDNKKSFYKFDYFFSDDWKDNYSYYYSTWPKSFDYWDSYDNLASLSIFDFEEIQGNKFFIHA